MKTFLQIVGIVALCCIGGCVVLAIIGGAAVNKAANDPDVQEAVQELQRDDAVVDILDFHALYEGMTYDEAVAAIGSPGELQSSNTIGAGTQFESSSEMYKWENGPLSGSMIATFSNGKLMSKSQFGLD